MATGRAGRQAAAAAAVALLLSGCANGETEGWTVEQAEAVDDVRGLSVRDVNCRGLGASDRARYASFACSAGARAAGEQFETVAVLYEIHFREGGYRLEAVRFVGGPGIP